MTLLFWLNDIMYLCQGKMNTFRVQVIYNALCDRYTLNERCYLSQLYDL
jgi:hypothetical protein